MAYNGVVSLEPKFYVRDIPVYGDTILSPMAGYSDVPYRQVCRAFGSAMHYTEFVAVEMLLTRKPNRYWELLHKAPGEKPMVFQIFGNNPQTILAAAQRIEAWGPDIIDINMGCSTRRVSGRGAGVGMMRQPEVIAETFALLNRHLQVPITGKIRLGWDEQKNFLEIGRILEDNGAALIAIHGRTKEQKYNGRADWDAIAALKQSVSVPVIGNGDVREPADIDRMLAYTGCDGVMIGRGAIGNPWLLARKSREDLTVAELFAAIRLHLAAMLAYYDTSHAIIMFRKHLRRYVEGFVVLDGFLPRLMKIKETEPLYAIVAEMEAMLAEQREAIA
ncbi:MAG: tRNA-dihydrouridine synthase family protein [Anaerolineales bacterium]|nr:tRNA-dihydrouridine synthase family protein [Anaerolineales bacterium]